MNKKQLKAAMILKGDKQTDLARALGISYQTLSEKMNGKSDFLAKEIQAIRDRYDLSAEALVSIFFDPELTKVNMEA